MSFSHNLNHNVAIQFVDQPYFQENTQVFSDKFLLNYPQEWLDLIKRENKLKVEEIYKGNANEDPASGLNFSLVRIL
ncbi:MAG: hypothetical protein AB4372_30915 [Xenococcus sp. (in: cyanobacteria)]